MNKINNIDLNLLKSLQALLSERHVGRAASRMNITQSAMSHTLARLRKTFADPLFIRTSKGLEPTEKALEITLKLDFVLNEIDHLFDSSTFDPAQVQNKICIQTHDFISATHLPRFFAAVRQQAPGIRFDIQMLTETSFSELEEGKVDLLIGAGLGAKAQVKQRGLVEEELVCLLDKHHPALKNWNTDTLFAYPHIKLSVLDERDDPISRYAKEHGLGPRIIGMHTQTLHMQPYVIQHSQLIAFVPKSVALIAEKLFNLAIVPCPFALPPLPIKALWHQRSQLNPSHQWIREQLAHSFNQELQAI